MLVVPLASPFLSIPLLEVTDANITFDVRQRCGLTSHVSQPVRK